MRVSPLTPRCPLVCRNALALSVEPGTGIKLWPSLLQRHHFQLSDSKAPGKKEPDLDVLFWLGTPLTCCGLYE